MKNMNNIPQKIFLLILTAGIICVVSVSVLTYHISTMSEQYRRIADEYFLNLSDSNDIRILLYRHQTLVANHVFSDSEDKFTEFEEEALAVKDELDSLFIELGKRMKGGEKEQIFHNAYTSFFSYLENAENAFSFSRAGNNNMANYYVTEIMDNCIKTVNASFDELDRFTACEITDAKEQMNDYIKISVTTAVISIVVIIAVVIFTSIYCFRITYIMNNKHTEKMLSLQNNIVMSMASLIESRDGDTGEHVRRTSVYVNMLANKAKNEGYETGILTDDYIELLTKAAPLHDVGKITIPDSILLKPGKLSDEEFEQIKLHACNGGEIVRRIIDGIEEQEYIDIAIDIATYHHEKWDGSGYNKGISGTDIPLCARIMAIADVFDALISKRCYKDAFTIDEAFSIIEESEGKHFDPTLAKLFVSMRTEIEDYLDKC